MRIFQVLTTLSFGDAVSNDCIAIKELLKKNGYKTMIYAENIGKKVTDPDVKPYNRMPRLKKDDVILYHLSTGTALNLKIKDLPCRKYMIYHNTTPPDFFVPYSGKLAKLCNNGIEETKALKDTFNGVFAVSQFNADQLRSFGYTCEMKIRPILIPFDDYKKEPDRETAERMRSDDAKNILFVGRIAPNKKQEDLISLLYAYRQMYSDPVRLILAGSPSGMEKYMARLKCYADSLGLKDIVFTGQISFPEILAYLSTADCFVSMSEHEGFCVPLVEAMQFNVPILAYSSTAIPETLGGTGILLDSKDPSYAAAHLHEILNNEDLRKKMVLEQSERLKDFSYGNISALFMKQLKEFIG